VDDDDASNDRGHRERWALQHNNHGPKYVTGTNCNFFFHLPTSGGAVRAMSIRLLGKTWSWPGANMPAAAPIGVRFCSTDYPHGTRVVCTVTGTYANGSTFNKQLVRYTYNKYGVIYKTDDAAAMNPELDGFFTSHGHVPAITYRPPVGNGQYPQWPYTLPKFEKICETATAISYQLHGSTTLLGPLPTGPYITPEMIRGYTYARNRIPDMNVIFAASCTTAQYPGERKVGSLIPGAFGFTLTGMLDRAYVGFDHVSIIALTTIHAFWDSLGKGNMVVTAALDAQADYDDNMVRWNLDPDFLPAPARLRIWGDTGTTLCSVYRGANHEHYKILVGAQGE